MPVFDKGASATENSLITAGRSLFVENNYGYQDPFGPNTGALTTPGFARVDVDERRQGLPQGLDEHDRAGAERRAEAVHQDRPDLHLHARADRRRLEQPYFWTAINARTGKTACKVYAGSGLGFNNNYAGIALGPDGTAYLGRDRRAWSRCATAERALSQETLCLIT